MIAGWLRSQSSAGGELGVGQQAAFGADMLAAEAEAAIDRADQQRLEQRAVGVAVDDAGHGGKRVIADRVGPLVGRRVQFVGMRDELAPDRVVRVGDQRGQGGRDGDGVALAHLVERGTVLRRGQPGGDQGGGVSQGGVGRKGAVRHGGGV